MTTSRFITPFGGKSPSIHEKAYVDISARIIGDVSVAAGAILRADSDMIRIGERTAVLDLALIEAPEGHPAIVEDESIISHGVVIHGAFVGARCLVGIGAIVLDGAVINEGSIIAAGSLVPQGTDIPPHSFFAGVPGKRLRETTPGEGENIMKQLQGLYKKSRAYLAPEG
jgi:carbonic anhydrase/acetyltransferase-like protein (isoleucine patch superfamily)